MKVKITHSDKDIEITYDEDGYIEYVTNLDSGKKMMMESFVEGKGYKIEENTFLMKMDVCSATYYRIIDLDLFVPKFIFIKNTLNNRSNE